MKTEQADITSGQRDTKSAIRVLRDSVAREPMGRPVALRTWERSESVIPPVTRWARLIVSLGFSLVMMDVHAAAPEHIVTSGLHGVRDSMLASAGAPREPFRYGSRWVRGVSLAQASELDTRSPLAAAQVTTERLAAGREFWALVKTSEGGADSRVNLEMFAALTSNRLERLEDAAKPQTLQAGDVAVSPSHAATNGVKLH